MNKQYLFNNIKESTQGRGAMLQSIREWIDSDELSEIISSFGGKIPDSDSIEEKAKWLLDFSECWDYRRKQKETHDKNTGENARWKVTNEGIRPSQIEAVRKGIQALGLIGIEKPQKKEFDYVIALGGARFSCLYRPQYAYYLLKEGEITAKEVVLLSGMRPVLESERAATDTYAQGARTEYDLINAGAEQVFHLRRDYLEERYYNENQNKAWAIRRYECQDGLRISSFSGPSSEPEKRRANSSDTYQFFIKKENIQKGDRLLLVTSQIYVPYQQIEAVRTLAEPYGIYIETVGFPTEWSGKLQGMMEPANYLQEIRSAVQAINRYLDNI